MAFRDFLKDDSGAAAAEYALILAIVGSGVATAAFFLGSQIAAALTGAADDITTCTTTANPSC